LPVVITSVPASKNSSVFFLVIPTPGSAAFSPLTITKSNFFFLIKLGSFLIKAFPS